MHGHDDDFISGADESSMVTGVRPRRPGTSPDPSHLTPLQTYLVKTGKDHYFTYRPDEYYQNPSDYDLKAVLCSITEVSGSLHFSFGADIVFLRFARNMGLNYEAYLGEISQSKYPEIKFKIPEGKRRTLFLEAKERLHETKAKQKQA